MTRPERIAQDHLLAFPKGSADLGRLVAALVEGAVLVYPTETIYGLGGLSCVRGVREKVIEAKGRAADNPLILLAADRRCFDDLPIAFPPAAELLARAFWPGRITLVLPSPDDATGIAVRVSPHPFVRALFQFAQAPIYSTSANRSGEPYVNDPEVIAQLFAGRADFFVDAGVLPASAPSSVVRVDADDTVTVLREGTVPASVIHACVA